VNRARANARDQAHVPRFLQRHCATGTLALKERMSNKKFKMDSDDDDSDEEVIKEVTVRGKKAIEDEYIKMNPREHVLLRPDMYVGAITRVPQEMWIWDEEQKKMLFKKIQFGMSDPFLSVLPLIF
jgi:DUF438 domain-containing protein